MNIRPLGAALLGLTLAPAGVLAAELGRLDLTAPGAMISTCGGLNWSGSGYAVGDKGVWLPGLASCNAAQAAGPATSVGAAAAYLVSTPEPVDASASGQAVMGELKLSAHSRATPAAGFAQAEATGGWMDVLTVTPLNAADIGKTAAFSFGMHVAGTLAGQLPGEYSFNSGAGLGIKPYIDGASLPPGPLSEYVVSGQGQYLYPYNQTVDQVVLFSGNITLGTPFALGVFARALAGNSSSGSVYTYNDATVDFSNTITWAGISGVTLGGAAVAYTLGSASGIDWSVPYAAAVPEPQAWLLMAAGLAGIAVARLRRRVRR